MYFLKYLSDKADNIAKFIVIISMLGMSIVIFCQIFCRYVLNYSLFWSEEVARFLMIWSIFMGASVALKRGELAAVSFMINSFREKTRKIILIAGNCAVISFFLIIIIYGYKFVMQSLSYLAPTLPVPMAVQYSSVLLSTVIMFLHILYFTFEHILSLKD
jgi:TRAP-type C4-dicarboxylate transport system permease small subunit